MFVRSGFVALHAPEDGGDAAGGAGGGKEHEGGDKSKDDVVPKTQFIAAINSANAKYNALEAKFNELQAELKKPAAVVEPKRYTRAELNAMVTAGTATQEQADAQMDHQMREDNRAEAARIATETVTAAQRKGHVDSEIARYKTVAPEILDETHETRARIKEEFQALVELGDDPRELATQLKAIRSVLGPVDKLEKARGGRPAHQSHQESGGGGGEGGGKKKEGGPLTYDDLSPREKAHYDKQIANGLYKDRKAVNEELKHASNRLRSKYGALA